MSLAKKEIKIAIVGTQGLPNNYGGFETLADFLVRHLAHELDITVYCSSVDLIGRQKEYRAAKLTYIPISSHGALGIIYDSISLLSAVRKFDKILLLGFGAGFIIPFISKSKRRKIILNFGGLDWQRSKWSRFAQKAIKFAEKQLVLKSNHLISDNIGIKTYIKETYNLESNLIAYGGDQVNKENLTEELIEKYSFLKGKYAFIVTRIQPDNNIEMMLNAFKTQGEIPFVVVGNWNSSKYGMEVRENYKEYSNLILLDAIYDRLKLDQIRSNCWVYIHGHSAGGTNPSLCEAMFLVLPIMAYSSGYNEHTTKNKALYFNSEQELIGLISSIDDTSLAKISKEMKEIAEKEYKWSEISEKYKQILLK